LPDARPAAYSWPVARSTTAQHRILIVEDEDRLREMLHTCLRDSGYDVISASDGLEALDWLSRLRVDLIVTDLLMPSMGGDDLVKRVRGTKEWAAIPILLVSGYGDLPPYTDLPVDATQLKPFEISDLLDRVRRLIGPPLG